MFQDISSMSFGNRHVATDAMNELGNLIVLQ